MRTKPRILLNTMNLLLLACFFPLCVQAIGIISDPRTEPRDENRSHLRQQHLGSSVTGSGINSTEKKFFRKLNMMGGYYQSDLRNPFVIQAAEFAVKALAESNKYSFLISKEETSYNFEVIEASQQVVAGTNYKLTIGVSSIDDTVCLGAFKAVLWDHFGELSVTKWGEELSCEEAESLKSN
mmetsp:Transcript_9492/g.11374  ORF Transcript_9492/g.11374 Transcript_9492/m.11374 type:complete len:182 (-) Transcript_9492:450-995(-)